MRCRLRRFRRKPRRSSTNRDTSPDARANSLNAKIASSVTPAIVGTRPAKTTSKPDAGHDQPRAIGSPHRCGFSFKHQAQKTKNGAANRERDRDDEEISAKNWIVQRDLRRHHFVLFCSATRIRFKRTTIVCTTACDDNETSPIENRETARSIGSIRHEDRQANVSHAPMMQGRPSAMVSTSFR